MVRGARAQASLEMAVAILCALVLLLGGLRLCVWINSRLVERQRDYEDTRPGAASVGNPTRTQARHLFYEPKTPLDIFQ